MKDVNTIMQPAVLFCLALLCGCANTQPAKLYVLHSPKIEVKQRPQDDKLRDATVVVGQVRIPKHLDRPTIMTQSSDSELSFSEFRRWAGPLEDELTRVISINLVKLLGSNKVAGHRFIREREGDYRVDIQILRMTGALGKEAQLAAQWRVLSGSKNGNAKTHIGKYQTALAGDDYGIYVAAQSKMIADLSRDIADTLRAQRPPVPKK